MSKPIVRIALAVLVSLLVIAVVATTVQARFGSVLSKVSPSAALQAAGRTSFSTRSDGYYHQFQQQDPGSHDCGSSSDDG